MAPTPLTLGAVAAAEAAVVVVVGTSSTAKSRVQSTGGYQVPAGMLVLEVLEVLEALLAPSPLVRAAMAHPGHVGVVGVEEAAAEAAALRLRVTGPETAATVAMVAPEVMASSCSMSGCGNGQIFDSVYGFRAIHGTPKC